MELEAIRGGTKRLSAWRGEVLVVFYEPREKLETNAELKRALSADTTRDARVVAVGDVASFDFAPARTIARTAIRALARDNDLEILLDWRGQLAAPPFSLMRGESNVLVLDRRGRIAHRHTGVMTPRERERFFEALDRALGER